MLRAVDVQSSVILPTRKFKDSHVLKETQCTYYIHLGMNFVQCLRKLHSDYTDEFSSVLIYFRVKLFVEVAPY